MTAVFPNVETILAQVIAVTLVLGSYALSRYQAIVLPRKHGLAPFSARLAPPAAEV